MRIVMLQVKILRREVINVHDTTRHVQRGERSWLTYVQLTHGINMVLVHMHVAHVDDQVAHTQSAYVRHHVREQRIRSDIERHSESQVARALVHAT